MKPSIILVLCLFIFPSAGQVQAPKSWKDLNYAGDTMNYHNLDIYLPKNDQPVYPAVVVVYGSAWFGNNLKGSILNNLGKPLLDAGFAVIAPNHRSSREARFPAQINDIKAAIRFIRANAGKYQIDSSFIAITGFSSGGHLAALAGTSGSVGIFTVGSESADIEGNVGEYTSFSSSVDAVVDWFGPTDFLKMDSCGSNMAHNPANSPESSLIGGAIQENKDKCALANPITFVNKKNPPFLILHGDKDPLVPHAKASCCFRRFKKPVFKASLFLSRKEGTVSACSKKSILK